VINCHAQVNEVDDDDGYSAKGDEAPSPVPTLEKLRLDTDSETDDSSDGLLVLYTPQKSCN
jgi:hypothetical protein